ncbi:MAG: helix-turn-helix domain-containing protein [Ruminococcus sp.]|nr:helix-turn-helix domain-containing protein [Ruminococcus sp.]
MYSNFIENSNFTIIFKQVRIKAGLTLEELAYRTNLSENYIGRIERGISCPTFEKFIYICNGLEIYMTNFALKMENPDYIYKKTTFISDMNMFNKKVKYIKYLLCAFLIEIRKEKNLTQEALAFESNINKTYYGFIERGDSNPTLNKIFLLCNALDIRFYDILIYIERSLSKRKLLN